MDSDLEIIPTKLIQQRGFNRRLGVDNIFNFEYISCTSHIIRKALFKDFHCQFLQPMQSRFMISCWGWRGRHKMLFLVQNLCIWLKDS